MFQKQGKLISREINSLKEDIPTHASLSGEAFREGTKIFKINLRWEKTNVKRLETFIESVEKDSFQHRN